MNLAYKLLVIIALDYPKLLTKKLKDIKTSLAKQDAEVTKVPHYNEGSLKFLQKLIDDHKDDFKVSETYLETPVEASSLLGLTIITNRGKIHIDVLEKEHCFAISDLPNWHVVYKIRLFSYVPKINRHILVSIENDSEKFLMTNGNFYFRFIEMSC